MPRCPTVTREVRPRRTWVARVWRRATGLDARRPWTDIRTFVDPQNPKHVAVLMDVADMDAFQTAMQSEGAAEAMAYDGVLPETLVILVEA